MPTVKCKTISELMQTEFHEYVEDDGKYFTIKSPVYYNGYDIEKSCCMTHKSILSMMHHLSGKTWMKSEILNEFIEKACKSANINLY